MQRMFFVASILFLLVIGSVQAQDTAKVKKDTVRYWTKRGMIFNLSFSNSTYDRWVAGGVNSTNIVGLYSGFAIHEGRKFGWTNFILLGLGGVKQQKMPSLRKTDDRLIVISKYSYKQTETFRYTAMVDFRTQTLDGFNFPKLESDSGKTLTSALMAPGYLQTSFGLEWKPKKWFYILYSPLASKFTFVLNDTLSQQKAFGLENAGDRVRSEIWGTSLNSRLTLENIVKNVTLTSNLNLFSNYVWNIEKHVSIDVNWDNILSLKVNKFITATWTCSMIYDEDVRQLSDPENPLSDRKPYVQWKNVIALGVNIKLGDEYKDISK